MVVTHTDLLPAYLATREVFLQQVCAVFTIALRGEAHAAAKCRELLTSGNMVLCNTQKTDHLVDWMFFEQRRLGKTLSQIVLESRGPSEPTSVTAS